MNVRLGLVANNENHCRNCDSGIGFGIYNYYGADMDYQACGNRIKFGAVDIPAFGYILVQ
jgi:hypothetical protein